MTCCTRPTSKSVKHNQKFTMLIGTSASSRCAHAFLCFAMHVYIYKWYPVILTLQFRISCTFSLFSTLLFSCIAQFLPGAFYQPGTGLVPRLIMNYYAVKLLPVSLALQLYYLTNSQLINMYFLQIPMILFRTVSTIINSVQLEVLKEKRNIICKTEIKKAPVKLVFYCSRYWSL